MSYQMLDVKYDEVKNWSNRRCSHWLYSFKDKFNLSPPHVSHIPRNYATYPNNHILFNIKESHTIKFKKSYMDI